MSQTFTLRAQPPARQRFIDLTTGLQMLQATPPAPPPPPVQSAPPRHEPRHEPRPVSAPSPRPEPRVSAFSLAAKSLKCCITLSPVEVERIRVKEGGPKQELHIAVAGRTVRVWLSAKSLRKAKFTIAEHGPDNVVVKIDGRLDKDDILLDAGLQCVPKTPPKAADALPVPTEQAA